MPKVNRIQRIYGSYSFVDKDPIIFDLEAIVVASGLTLQTIANRSDVAVSTLYNMFHGKTRRPQNATIEAVTRSLGYSRQFSTDAGVPVHFANTRSEMTPEGYETLVRRRLKASDRRAKRKQQRRRKTSGAIEYAHVYSAH